MEDIEYVLEFGVEIGKQMISSGANIERVYLVFGRLANVYHLHDLTCDIRSTQISVAAKDKNGLYCQRQLSIPYTGLDMDRLVNLNHLTYKIEEENIKPCDLQKELATITERTYNHWWKILGYTIAMLCLGRIFCATWQELIIIELNTLILYGLQVVLGKLNFPKIINNFISMFLVTLLSIMFVYIGFAENFYTIIITTAFFLINGVGMVNATKNVVCGNEVNGIVDLLRVMLECIAIVAGLASAFAITDGAISKHLEESIVTMPFDVLHNLELVFVSFWCSFGFAIVFNIHGRDLVYAGVGGLIIRVVYIIVKLITTNRFVYMVLAAFGAALYSEILAIIKKEVSTTYLYPSIVPLIPGDLLYYAMLGVVWTNDEMIANNTASWIIALVGISIGFVVCSSFVYYVRKFKIRSILKTHKLIK